MDMKRFFLYAIVIAALALAGCGGNGGGKTPTDGSMMPTTHDVTIPMLPMGYNSLPAGSVTVSAGGTMDHGDVTFSCPAGGADCMITVAEDGSVTSTGGMATAARSAASMARQTDDETAATAATTKVAGTKATAIAREAAQATDAGLGGSATDGSAVDTYSMEISRTSAATTIKITDSALAGDMDPKFTQAMDLGGGTTMHTRPMKADDDGNVVEEVVVVTTDIAAPKATAFARVPGQALNARDLDPTRDTDGDNTPDNDYTALTIVAGADDVNLPKIMSARFAAQAAAQLTFAADVASTTGNDEAAEIAGTYNGAMGTYRCNGTSDCTVTVDGDGDITAISDGWVFTPASGATSDVPDADYLHYGFWLKRTTDSDGVLTYNEVETFAGASVGASDGAELNSVTGSASYNGGATGVYVKNNINTDGTIASATSGHFTATANLMAHFQQTVDDTNTSVDEAGRLAPNLLNTITGTISDFMLSGGEENNWSVTLNGTRTAGENTFTGTAKGGVTGQDGSLSGMYYGTTPDTASDGDGTNKVAPGIVVGEFNSVFSNGSVAGAFGARKQQ